MGQSNKPSKRAKSKPDIANKKQAQRKKNTKGSPTISLPSRITTYTLPPPNWPSSLPYLSTSHLDPSLTPSQHALVHPLSLPQDPTPYVIQTAVTYSPTINPLITITPITDPSHPAYSQHGLFTTRFLPSGTHILDYTGLLHSCPLPTCSASDYDLAFLSRDASIAIDGQSMGNEARFINDYHGVNDAGPNAIFEEYFVKVKGKGGKEVWQARMGVWVKPGLEAGIGKGEEILLSYGRGYWKARGLGGGGDVAEPADQDSQGKYLSQEKIR